MNIRTILYLLAILLWCAPNSFAARFNATGLWEYSTFNHWTNDWDCLESPTTNFTAIAQNRDTFTYVSPAGIHTGRIHDVTYSSTIAYPEDYGMTVQLIEFDLLSATEGKGVVLWYWTDGFFECSGGSDISLRKLPTRAVHDATGLWDYRSANVWNSCGDGLDTVTGVSAIIQEGTEFRFAGFNGTQLGELSDTVYVATASYFDDELYGVDSIILELDSPALGSGWVDWYITDGWSECWGSDFLTVERREVTNAHPEPPILTGPANGSAGVPLAPLLRTGGFADPDGDAFHGETEWQISTDPEFTSSVFRISSGENLTSIRVPRYILAEGTTYYWRARFYDEFFAASGWSRVSSFITLAPGRDLDGNGIPDAQELDTPVDLDANGVPDTEQADMKAVRTAVGGGQMGVTSGDAASVSSIDFIESIDPGAISELARPYSMPLGLLGMELTVTNPIDTAEVTVHFSEPAPEGAVWLMYDSTRGWVDYSKKATFNEDRRSVRLKLKDWSFGDSDGLPNGTIIDPGGFGLASWIMGRVHDAGSGTGIPEAVVTIEGLSLPCRSDGNFVSVILPGTYTVTASAPGYADERRSSVTIPEGGTMSLDFGLSAAGSGPETNLRVNGSDTPFSVPVGTPIRLDLSVMAGIRAGVDADWWLVAATPMELYTLNLSTLSWEPVTSALTPTFQGPLVDLLEVPLAGLTKLPSASGTYTFYFGVDTAMNGILDGDLSYDSVTVHLAAPD